MSGSMTEEPKKTNVAQQIDENLRRAYQRVLETDVPDRFAQLLEQLKAKEGKK